MPPKLNLKGQMFGRLTVICEAEPKICGARAFTQWICQCACGASVTTYGNGLRSGHVKSCGCLKSELTSQRNQKHEKGVIDSNIYKIWKTMRSRCENKNSQVYKHYGARGISVCERWKSFDAFSKDVGARPVGTTLDRIDNDGNYEPGNVRWATHKVQHNNKRSNVMVLIRGRIQSMQAWADELGIPRHRLKDNLEKYGASIQKRSDQSIKESL